MKKRFFHYLSFLNFGILKQTTRLFITVLLGWGFLKTMGLSDCGNNFFSGGENLSTVNV